MQGWIAGAAPTQTFETYKRRCQKVYSFDLQGCGTLQFPERDVFCLAGFSEKTPKTLKFLESNKSALIARIEAIELWKKASAGNGPPRHVERKRQLRLLPW